MRVHALPTETTMTIPRRPLLAGLALLLGTFPTREAAEKHEREIQYFKRH